ncbi:MAG: RNA 2',3'-cyclic phosphodiesterase [Pseudonocardiaceae bacterium]
MRLFVALGLPGVVVEELHSVTAGLRSRVPGLRWTRPEQWHLTLAFVGEVDGDVVAELARRLHRAAGRHPPLTLALSGGGRFGHRVLWTGVQGDRDGLRRLAASAAAAARRCGLPGQHESYRPHLTLARASGEADLRPLVDQLRPWTGSPWVASRIQLMRSHLGAGQEGAAVHELISGWPLSGQRKSSGKSAD